MLSAAEIEFALTSGDERLQHLVHAVLCHPYYQWQPRPDDPENYEEQTSFAEQNYRWDPADEQFLYSDPHRFKICLGGTGSGKTAAAAFKVAQHVLETPPPRDNCPFWIVGEVLDQICQVAWLEKLEPLIPESEILGVVWHRRARRWPSAVMLRRPESDQRDKCGWVLEFKSYEQGLGGLKAVSIGGYWFNEEVPFHHVAEVQGRCRDYDSPGWADFTPIECKDPEWPEAYENPPEGWRFYHLNNLRNNYLSDGWAERFLAGIPEDMRPLRQIGSFTVLRGAVYKEWRKHLHVRSASWIEERIQPHWPRIRGLDFGFNNPFACEWVARDPDGRYYVYDEHYEAQKLNVHHADEINARVWDYSQPWYGPTYSDHDAQQRAEFAEHGIYCTPANKSINQGIECIRKLLMVQGDGLPRLFVSERCKNLIWEFPKYRWPDGSVSRNPADTPIDKDNHCLAGGTMITTKRGEVPIECVTTSDRVMTRAGWRSVMFSGPTRIAATCKVILEDGRIIEGTEDHKVFTLDRGWVPMGTLMQCDTLLSLKGDGGVCASPKWWNSTAFDFADTLNQSGESSGNISYLNTDGDCIKQSGSITTGLYPRGTTFTTSTKTPSTTQLTICSANRHTSTYQSIRESGGAIRYGERRPRIVWRSEMQPAICRDGVYLAAAEPRHLLREESHGRAESQVGIRALCAGPPFNPGTRVALPSFAQENAGQRIAVGRESITNRENANCAAACSWSTDTARPFVAPVRVVAVLRGSELKQTYDLTVHGEHEFFANGVLVHNCLDALRYAIYTDWLGGRSGQVQSRRERPDEGRHGVRFKRRRGA